ncbi:hypothetical protein C8Q73DRAFT_637162 [Cubamyces lactineus]|nr:hypothetical protein C8Q73DRAFT_637162 [Cubamyces lactineus]
MPDLNCPLLLDKGGWPSWVREAYTYMEAKQFGPDFMRVVEWWTIIERNYKWKTSPKGLSTEHRPGEVGHWLRVLRRNLQRPLPISNVKGYGESWWKWWSALQPSWRICNERGRPVPGGIGDWGALVAPGKNGLLIVLLSLVWWRDAESNSTLEDWLAGVADVRWVVQSMAALPAHQDP